MRPVHGLQLAFQLADGSLTVPGQHREQLGKLPRIGIFEQVREQAHVIRGVIRECGGRQGLLQLAQLVIAKDRAAVDRATRSGPAARPLSSLPGTRASCGLTIAPTSSRMPDQRGLAGSYVASAAAARNRRSTLAADSASNHNRLDSFSQMLFQHVPQNREFRRRRLRQPFVEVVQLALVHCQSASAVCSFAWLWGPAACCCRRSSGLVHF